jgi:hypothetical protein
MVIDDLELTLMSFPSLSNRFDWNLVRCLFEQTYKTKALEWKLFFLFEELTFY